MKGFGVKYLYIYLCIMITTILSVLAIHLLAVMSPGPDFIITVKHALSYGRKAGIWTAIGIGL